MAITLTDYPPIQSPAACPKCGSMDLTRPWLGRRSNLHLSSCRDCHTRIRSSEPFTVLERKALVYGRTDEHVPRTDGFARLTSATIKALNDRDPKLKQTREPGEEG